ncbi:cobyric acid synthase [Acidaminobacterium chupaoyuni]
MAKAIMIQGTMSNAGKSVLTAGLCRVFKQDGYRVAPFKSQNMALNSFITKEGLEMGRAQVMQAEAAGIEPSVKMNPILLKPTNDVGSQVIVNGEVIGNMSAAEYFRYKKKLVPQIMEAYHQLESENDIIVIEGAGSPAEINLKSEDIVNMGMAEMANAPVLLAGDIDRGGVFASLYGTVALLEPQERARIRGLIINKFRGDPEILKPGLAMLEKLTDIPVVGVVPMMKLDLEDEDSLSVRLEQTQQAPALLDIAVIRLPRISNFTDFNALEQHSGVGVRYVSAQNQLGAPDLVILPGTKNTMGDLAWMRQNGLEAAIKKLAAQGTPVIGICGGYQMMGRQLSDPQGLENGGEMQGMQLLPLRTVFEPQKIRTRVSGTVRRANGLFAALCGAAFEGYEIHMGHTVCEENDPWMSRLEDGQGISSEDGYCRENALGSYVHGIFDSGDFAERLVELLLRRKGIDPAHCPKAPSYAQYKEQEYDKLAAGIRSSLDMKKIYEILEAGI